jgi:hypothetical protein
MFFARLLKISPVFFRDLSCNPCSSMCSLTTYVTRLPTLKYLFFADAIKIYGAINCPQDCNLLQFDINSVQGWCIANSVKLNISKTKVISFSIETNVVIDYKLCEYPIMRTDTIKVLRAFIKAELHFHDHVSYIFSHCIKLLGLVRTISRIYGQVVYHISSI